MKIIKIRIEYHSEDPYYTDFDDLFFYSTDTKTNEDIDKILQELKVKQVERSCIHKDIDREALIEQLKSYEIYELEADVNCQYNLNEESDYAEYEE